jgi:hypothetical protein
VSMNSMAQLGEDSPASFFDDPNITTVNNVRNGIRCRLGGVVRGHLGSSNQLNGTVAQQDISTNCPNDIVTP